MYRYILSLISIYQQTGGEVSTNNRSPLYIGIGIEKVENLILSKWLTLKQIEFERVADIETVLLWALPNGHIADFEPIAKF